MKVSELKDDFKTDIVSLSELGSIFRTKENKIGDFYKEKLSGVKERFGEREIDFYSYDCGSIVLKPRE